MRKAISRVKGGRLALAAYPAKVKNVLFYCLHIRNKSGWVSRSFSISLFLLSLCTFLLHFCKHAANAAHFYLHYYDSRY